MLGVDILSAELCNFYMQPNLTGCKIEILLYFFFIYKHAPSKTDFFDA